MADRPSAFDEVTSPEQAEAILAAMATGLFPTGLAGFELVSWAESLDAAPGLAGATAEARALAVEKRFRLLVEQIPAVTFMAVLGEGKNEVYVSPHIEALLGYTQAEWLENPILWYSRLHPDDRTVWNDEFTRGCQSGGPFRAECRFMARAGNVVWVHGEARLVKDERGRPMYLQGVAFDITESKRAQENLVADAQALERHVEERTSALRAANEGLAREIADRKRIEVALRESEQQLRQSQKMEAIGRLAGGVAHDFNNLLSVILSYSEMLAADLPPGTARAGLEEIERAAMNAAELTAQLLAFGRKQLLAPAVVDLNDVLSGMRDMIVRLIGEDIETQVRLAPGLRKIEVDPRQIQQVLLNLVVNARDAMAAGGTLVIATDNVELSEGYASAHPGVTPGMHVMLSVADTGTGMDAATRARAFEPFFTTKAIGKGSGLGLSTVFGIVQQSGGTIETDSEPGQGARFSIYFPSLDVRPSQPPGARPSAKPARGTETILLVEDNGQVRALVRTLLRSSGYNVLDAANAREAELLSGQFSGEIHLLLTDVVMPKMNGRELAERLTSARPSMRVLLMSGYTDDALVQHGLRGAKIAFLQKPITRRTLAEKVRQTLDADVLPTR